MTTLYRSTFLFLIISFFISALYFSIPVQNVHAEISDEDAAATLKAYNDRQKKNEQKEYLRALEAEPTPTLTPSEPSAAAKASIDRRKSEARAEERSDPDYGTDSPTGSDITKARTQREKSEASRDNDPTSNGRSTARGDRDTSTERGSSQRNDRNSNNTNTQERSTEQERPTGGFFNKVFGKGGFFSRLFGGGGSGSSRTRTSRDDNKPEHNSRTTPSVQQDVDLVPIASRATVRGSQTTFFGKINTSPTGDVSCKDGSKSYKEGESVQTLTNSDGSKRAIADASYVCRKGEWKIEGSLPGPRTNPNGNVLGANTTREESDGDNSESYQAVEEEKPSWFDRVFRKGKSEKQSDSNYTKENRFFPEASSGNRYTKSTTNGLLTNTLLIDYNCDSTVDDTQEFQVKHTGLRGDVSRTIPISATISNTDTVPAGDHCFAFKVDTKNIVTETNEQNNQSNWQAYSVTSFADVLPTPAATCQNFSKPLCGKSERLVSGTVGSDGCRRAPQCVNSSAGISESLENISFEVKSTRTTEDDNNPVPITEIINDWTSNDITIGDDEELVFRWDATAYGKCLVYINPTRYNFDRNITSNQGNTEISGIDVREITGTYAVDCIQGDQVENFGINVTVR